MPPGPQNLPQKHRQCTNMLTPPPPKTFPLLLPPQRLQRHPQDLGQEMSPRDAFRAADDDVRDLQRREHGAHDGCFAGCGDTVDNEG